MKNLITYTICMLFLFIAVTLFAQEPVITLQEFSSGYTSPVDIKNCNDSRLFIVQKDGYIYTCDSLGSKSISPFLDVHTKISTGPGGERGLLGAAFHPDYFNNGFFFVYYTRVGDGAIRISRFSVDSLNEDAADANSEVILMEIPHPTYTNHNGGGLNFGPDGYLYAATGDGGSGGDPDGNAQNTKKYLGKMLRLDIDNGSPYSVPADNPFVNDPVNYYPEIWAYGLRNPWRYSFDRLTGDLWIGDVGQDAWEEIDFMPVGNGGGQNYGWDCYEGTHAYQASNCSGTTGLTFPVYEYAQVSGSGGDCSVTGGYVYRGGQYGNLYGRYLCADYCSGKFRTVTQNSDGTFTGSLVGDEAFFFSSFGEDRFGELYVADVSSGKIYKVADTSCLPTAQILANTSSGLTINEVVCVGTELQAVFGEGLIYQWQFDGTDISGATSLTYVTSSTGVHTLFVTNAANCTDISNPVVAGNPTIPLIDGINNVYCVTPLQSPDTLIGIPAGGFFSGDGMNGNTFEPSAAGVGSHTITYTYVNEFGCSASTDATLIVDACTNVNDVAKENGVSIFPIPNNGDFTIILKDPADKIAALKIFSISGQLIMPLNVPLGSSGIFNIQADYLPDGMYLLRIEKGTEILYKKIVIEN